MEKKEHVATGELRQLLTSEEPLSVMLAKARGKRGQIEDQLKEEKENRTEETINRPFRYSTLHGTNHELQPYGDFLNELTTKCHLMIDARRESLRILINNQHKKHRQTLLMNVEDIFNNWFDVPLGLLTNKNTVDGDQKNQEKQDVELE